MEHEHNIISLAQLKPYYVLKLMNMINVVICSHFFECQVVEYSDIIFFPIFTWRVILEISDTGNIVS